MPEFSSRAGGQASAADGEHQRHAGSLRGEPALRCSSGQASHLYGCALPSRGGTCDCGAQPTRLSG